MISADQKRKILQIVNVFETSTPEGRYDIIAVFKDGPVVNGERIKQITYGRSQTTEFGNLKRLLEMYIQMGGEFAADLSPYMPKLGKMPSLCPNMEFRNFLKEAGKNDPLMRKCQDDFFDSYYYLPALAWFNQFGFTEALSLAVIYDSFIHSGSIREDIRQKFSATPPVKGGDERTWIKQYVDARYDWLKNHSNQKLHSTVYRMNCFKLQIRNENWDLSQPVNAAGILIK